MALGLKGWLDAARTIDRLLELEQKHARLIETQTKRIDELTDRLHRLEAREEILIAEAKGAAAAAASGVASHHVGDLALKVGGIDERLKCLETAKPARKIIRMIKEK